MLLVSCLYMGPEGLAVARRNGVLKYAQKESRLTGTVGSYANKFLLLQRLRTHACEVARLLVWQTEHFPVLKWCVMSYDMNTGLV